MSEARISQEREDYVCAEIAKAEIAEPASAFVMDIHNAFRLARLWERAELDYRCSEGVIAMTVARLGGLVSDAPTHRGNFLQRIDALREMERAALAGKDRT